MKGRFVAGATLVAAVALSAVGAAPTSAGGASGGAVSSSFELVGHDPLFGRGMNAAPALFEHYVYVGNRTDGSTGPNGTSTHPHPGVLVVDVSNPASPAVVGEIGPPDEGTVGQTSRELRVWPEARLLLVMSFRCSSVIHDCARSQPDLFAVKFYDLTGEHAADPRLVSTYVPPARPHEMFLWIDPKEPRRALLVLSTPTLSTDPARPNLVVTDISRAREGIFTEVAAGNWNDRFSEADRATFGVFVHSMGVSADGTRTYLAHQAGQFLIVDSSDVAHGVPNPELRLLTDPADRPIWANPNGHSAVKVFGRDLVVTTDEVYGKLIGPDHGCPWGWVRVIDVSDEARPRIAGEFRAAENEASFCETLPAGFDDFVSFASHNPTVLRDLVLVTWHSSGLLAIDITDPARPALAGRFSPEPLPAVATEDPALSAGPGKVVMWSYPIIANGFIYAVDVRNGLYILRYHGPHAGEVNRIRFLEGNSNLGDALQLDARPTP